MRLNFHVLAELFNMHLKESCFSDWWNVSLVVLVFKNVGERSTIKNYRTVVFFLRLVKSLKNFVNNRIVNHLEKWAFFWLSVWFYVFLINCKLQTVVSDRITRAFNRSGASRAVALDISKGFDRVWHAGLLHKLKPYGVPRQVFGLISSFLSNRRLQVVLDGKSSQKYPVDGGGPQSSILSPTLFLLYINDLPDDVIYYIAIYAHDTTLYSKCDQASDLWQQLELVSELSLIYEAGFKLSISGLQNVIYFSIIMMPKKIYITIFAIQYFVKYLLTYFLVQYFEPWKTHVNSCQDHVCKLNEWMFSWLFPSQI